MILADGTPSAYLNALMEEGTKEDCFREVACLHAENEQLRAALSTVRKHLWLSRDGGAPGMIDVVDAALAHRKIERDV